MTNDQTIVSSEATPEKDALSTDESVSPEKDTQKTEDTDKDAAIESDEEKALRLHNEAKMWEGRAKKAKDKAKEKSLPISEEDLDWKIANSSRVSLVKEAYDKELAEFEESGAKITNALKTKALQYAESKVLPKASNNSDNSLPSPSIDRGGTRSVQLTPTDIALGVKPETVKEYRDYVEGR